MQQQTFALQLDRTARKIANRLSARYSATADYAKERQFWLEFRAKRRILRRLKRLGVRIR
jgi:hypothetical protein